MNENLKVIIFGLGVWLVPFLASLVIFPLKQAGNPLFESLMPVIITATVVILAISYFEGKRHTPAEGFKVGVIWLVISIIMDLLLFTWGPMAMTLTNYMADIGVTYIIIPVITFGMTYMSNG